MSRRSPSAAFAASTRRRAAILGACLSSMGVCWNVAAFPAEIARFGPVSVRSIEASAGFSRNDNILGSSPAEIRAFETADPGSFFVVESLDDRALEGRLALELATPSIGGSSLQWKLAAEGVRYIDNPIRSGSVYSLDLKQKFLRRAAFSLGIEFAPVTYARHRRDKDAGPGQPAFRADASSEAEYTGRLAVSISKAITPSITGSYGDKDYRPAFDERDQWRRGAGAGLAIRALREVTLDLDYEYARCNSRNSSIVGGDLSYREHVIALKARGRLPAGITGSVSVKEKFRRYTTDDAGDLNRYLRKDLIGLIEFRLARALAGPVGTYAAYKRYDRTARVPSSAGIGVDDEGSYEANVVAAGITFTWE